MATPGVSNGARGRGRGTTPAPAINPFGTNPDDLTTDIERDLDQELGPPTPLPGLIQDAPQQRGRESEEPTTPLEGVPSSRLDQTQPFTALAQLLSDEDLDALVSRANEMGVINAINEFDRDQSLIDLDVNPAVTTSQFGQLGTPANPTIGQAFGLDPFGTISTATPAHDLGASVIGDDTGIGSNVGAIAAPALGSEIAGALASEAATPSARDAAIANATLEGILDTSDVIQGMSAAPNQGIVSGLESNLGEALGLGDLGLGATTDPSAVGTIGDFGDVSPGTGPGVGLGSTVGNIGDIDPSLDAAPSFGGFGSAAIGAGQASFGADAFGDIGADTGATTGPSTSGTIGDFGDVSTGTDPGVGLGATTGTIGDVDPGLDAAPSFGGFGSAAIGAGQASFGTDPFGGIDIGSETSAPSTEGVGTPAPSTTGSTQGVASTPAPAIDIGQFGQIGTVANPTIGQAFGLDPFGEIGTPAATAPATTASTPAQAPQQSTPNLSVTVTPAPEPTGASPSGPGPGPGPGGVGSNDGAIGVAGQDPGPFGDFSASPFGDDAGIDISGFGDAAGAGDAGGDKVVCTAMCRAYGFGRFRQAIWLAEARGRHPAYEAGYHALAKPLIRYGWGNTPGASPTWPRRLVRGFLEHVARRRTADIWKQRRGASPGRRDAIGAIERSILEPLCFVVGLAVLIWKHNHAT